MVERRGVVVLDARLLEWGRAGSGGHAGADDRALQCPTRSAVGARRGSDEGGPVRRATPPAHGTARRPRPAGMLPTSAAGVEGAPRLPCAGVSARPRRRLRY